MVCMLNCCCTCDNTSNVNCNVRLPVVTGECQTAAAATYSDHGVYLDMVVILK